MPIEFNSNGIVSQNITEILSERESTLQGIDSLGPNFSIDKDTPIGNMELADANSELSIQELLAWLPSMLDVTTSEGVFLDWICAKNRIYRKKPQKTKITLVLNGDEGTPILKEDLTVSENTTGAYFNLNENVTIGETGTVTAEFICHEYGEITPSETSKFEILTPLTGLNSVTVDSNNFSISVGRDWETDKELARRHKESVQQTSTSIIESIKANLFSLDGVEHVKYIENDTENSKTTDGIVLPMKSFEMIVDGGLTDDIANSIYINKPVGTRAFGTTLVNVLDENKDVHQIGYSKAEIINVGIDIKVKTQRKQGSNWSEAIKSAIKDEFDNIQDIGGYVKDYDYYKIVTTFDNILDIENIEIYNIDDEERVKYSKYPINIHQIAKLDKNNINIIDSYE